MSGMRTAGPSSLIQGVLVLLLGAVILCGVRSAPWEYRCWPETEWSPAVVHPLQDGTALAEFYCPDGFQARVVAERIEYSCGARSR